jgi:hypothetical protein
LVTDLAPWLEALDRRRRLSRRRQQLFVATPIEVEITE